MRRVFPVSAWIDLVGFSMRNYFTLLAVAEGAVFALMIWILQRYVPDRRTRLTVFVLLIPFLFDSLLGFNTIAWRRLFVVVVLLIVAARPLAPRAVLAAGALTGVSIAYSYEFGLLGLGAALCIHGAMALGPERWGAVRAAKVLKVSCIAWDRPYVKPAIIIATANCKIPIATFPTTPANLFAATRNCG